MSDNEKRGGLTGGAATDEALASSQAVLWASRGGYRRGLQQFYTPAPVSEFIATALGFKPYRKRTEREWAYSTGRRVGVFDPTAGDGSLMAAFGDPCVKWGAEIDKDQIAAADTNDATRYHFIAGDIQRIVPLALSVGLAWPVVITNPPFGLVWDVPGIAEGSSTYVGWRVADALLAPHGIGAIIAGRDRFEREIVEEMGDRAMVIVEVADLFPGVDLECVIVFWHKSPFRAAPRLRVGRVGDLAALAPRVHTMLGAPYLHGVEVSEVHSRVSAVADEYERRLGQRLHGQASTVEIRSGRLSVVPSAFQKINIVTKHGGVEALRWIESFHRQTPAYFAQRAKEWRKIREWADGEIITIDAGVDAAVQGALDKVQRLTVPLYPVEPAQRLGFLADADHITCKVGDADRGFTAGTVYPIACATQVLAAKADRVKETLDGLEHYSVVVERKAMRITIGGHVFSEAPADLQFVLDHFDVPDPGNIGDRYPDEIRCYEAILRLVEVEIQEREPGFAFHPYQIADIARCCAQQGSVLAWEQGLGKCVQPDTKLTINDVLISAEDAWERYAGPVEMRDADGGEWARPKNALYVPSLVDGRMQNVKVGRLYRQRVHEQVRMVVLDDGSRIGITQAHALYDGVDWTNRIDVGGVVCVPSRLPHGVAKVSADLVRLLAWQIAEGSEEPTGQFSVTQVDRAVLEAWKRDAYSVGEREQIEFNSLPIRPGGEDGHHAQHIAGWSTGWRDWLDARGYQWGKRSAEKRIPEFLMAGDAEVAREFLRCYFEAEGCPLDTGLVEVSSASDWLIDQVRHLLRRFGIWARRHKTRKMATNGKRIMRTYYKLTIGGEDMRIFAAEIGFLSASKRDLLAHIAARPENSNWRGVPITDVIASTATASGLSRKMLGWRGASFRGNYSRRGLQQVLARMATLQDGSHLASLRAKPDTRLSGKRRTCIRRLERAALAPVSAAAAEIQRRCDQEVHYAHVSHIEWTEYDGYVYDMEVPGPHNFVAGDVLAHNTIAGGAFMRALELLAELRAERETKGGRARIIARLEAVGVSSAAAIADHLPRLHAPGLPDGCALFAMPQDLTHPQFSGEMMRFFGRPLVRVASAAFDLRHPRPKRRKTGGDCTAAEVAVMVAARRADLAAQACGVALAPRPSVWAITWFEALAVSGKTPEARRKLPAVERWRYNRGRGQGYPLRIRFPSKQHCPHCLTDRDGGWNGEVCHAEVPAKRQSWIGVPPRGKSLGGAKKDDPTRHCGYVHRSEMVKPAYSILARIGFRAVMVDEGTKIKGDTSLASKAIRAFRAPYRLVATGTPLKNFVIDLFWLLWWALGDASARFPYAYEGGRTRFLEDFGVVETKLSEHGGKAWDPTKGAKPPKERGAREKMLPEVSNLLQLWRMLCPSIARRRMEDVGCVVAESGAWTCKACKTTNHADVGAPYRRPDRLHCVCGATFAAIVPISFHPVRVPWGVEQRKLYAAWLTNRNFVNHFMSKHPDSPLMQSKDPDAVISLLAAGLGQLAKLEYATTDPMGDPDWGGPTIPGSLRSIKPSPWTPGRVQILEIAKAAALAGEQVLIGSCLVEPGPWIAERLREVGIAAAHITETDADGNVSTMPPAERARIVADFRAGKIRVLCVGIAAVNLGHNLDTASVVICDGLPWDFATWDQFLKRARRLTSRRPVKVYPILPHDSLATTKWQRLADKTAAADLAMDGKLWAKDERPIDRAALLRELQERGARLTGDEVDEDAVRRLWYGIPDEGEQMALAI